MNKIVGIINDPRLTLTMSRSRHGPTQVFNEVSAGLDNGEAVKLTPPEPHLYAEIVDGQWCWVNGCEECNGRPRNTAKSYVECKQHNVCRTCGTPRDQLTEAPWAGYLGWQCQPCYDAEHEEAKAEALAAMPEDFDQWDYQNIDTIKCPHCNEELEGSDHYDAIDQPTKKTCPRCDNTFELEGHTNITWTMKRV